MVKLNKLNDEIIIEIFYQLQTVNDKRNFILINKENYELLNQLLKKYRLILYVNNDYSNFYEIIKKNQFNLNYECDLNLIDKIIIRSFMYIPVINASRTFGFYDFRFIFELLYAGFRIETDNVKIYNIHFYTHFYSKIIKCIVFNDRKKTLKNIEKCPYLLSLKQKNNFKDRLNQEWISIHKE